jgi:hypothetical protein
MQIAKVFTSITDKEVSDVVREVNTHYGYCHLNFIYYLISSLFCFFSFIQNLQGGTFAFEHLHLQILDSHIPYEVFCG